MCQSSSVMGEIELKADFSWQYINILLDYYIEL
jgi:hypothetical protein